MRIGGSTARRLRRSCCQRRSQLHCIRLVALFGRCTTLKRQVSPREYFSMKLYLIPPEDSLFKRNVYNNNNYNNNLQKSYNEAKFNKCKFYFVLLHKCTEHQSTVHCKGSSIYKARGYTNSTSAKLYKYVAISFTLDATQIVSS